GDAQFPGPGYTAADAIVGHNARHWAPLYGARSMGGNLPWSGDHDRGARLQSGRRRAARRTRSATSCGVTGRVICVSLLAIVVASILACRRENPAAVRAAATATAVVQATVAPDRPSAQVRRARVAAGNLGVAATGISAGIQMWSRPGGVMAGGATMTGTVSDG